MDTYNLSLLKVHHFLRIKFIIKKIKMIKNYARYIYYSTHKPTILGHQFQSFVSKFINWRLASGYPR